VAVKGNLLCQTILYALRLTICWPAYDDSRQSTTLSTRHISGTENPTWNQWLRFGGRRWQYLDVSVWDEDSFLTGSDDRMTGTQSFFITPYGIPELAVLR